MSRGYLPDTNVLIAYLKNEPETVRKSHESEQLYLSATSLGELYYGAAKSLHAQRNREKVDVLASKFSVLAIDQDIAGTYGVIKAQLRVKGRPIPDNDVWIASAAVHFNLTMVTRDRHFSEIETLVVEHW